MATISTITNVPAWHEFVSFCLKQHHRVSPAPSTVNEVLTGSFQADLLIIDHILVGYRWREILDLIQKLSQQGLRVALVAGQNDDQERHEALDCGAVGYLVRTWSVNDLKKKIDALLKAAVEKTDG